MTLTNEQFAYYLIDRIEGLSIANKKAIIALFDEPKELIPKFDEHALAIKELVGDFAYEELEKAVGDRDLLKEIYNEFLSYDVGVLCYGTDDYPEKLYDLVDAPFVLYYRGNVRLLDGELVMINGTRNCTRYGMDMTAEFVESFVENDLIILSGISDGIDTACVESTLKLGGKQIVLCAGGMDRVSPSINIELKEKVEMTGLVISEYMPKISAQKYHYLLRNRLFAALTDVMVLVEAAEESNSLGAVRLASDMGKEIFAIPGNLNSKYSSAPNKLIANQTAIALVEPSQVVEIFKRDFCYSPKKVVLLDADEQKIVDAIGENSVHIDNICKQLGLTYSQIMSKLLIMESKKVVRRLAGNCYEVIK